MTDKPEQVIDHSKEIGDWRLSPNRNRITLGSDKPRSGFKNCYVNDDNDGKNIEAYLAAGYNFVNKATASSVHTSPDSSERRSKYVGNKVTAYLMQVPEHKQKVYKAEPARKSRELVSQIDNTLPGGTPREAEGTQFLTKKELQQATRKGFN